MTLVIELDVPDNLKEHGISRIAREGNTICIDCKDNQIRSTLHKEDFGRTMKGLDKKINGSMDNNSVQQISYCISKQWNKVLDGEDEDKIPEAEIIKDLAFDNCKFFRDQNGNGYGLVKIRDHYESISLKSNRYELYLNDLYYNSEMKMASKETIGKVIQRLQSNAEFNSPITHLHLRTAWSKDRKSIYYDLTDEDWNCVKIDRYGVNLEKGINFPIFKRYNQTLQPIPAKNYNPKIFDKFMLLTNVKGKDDILLTKVWMISTFIPELTCAIYNVHGGEGGAKTTTQKAIKITIDPDRPANLLSVSHDKIEFIQQLAHRHVAFYDNLKYIPPWLPDEICKAVTGGGTSKRQLFSDEGDIIFDFKVCMGFNGINMVMNEADVLRRSIIIRLESLEDSEKIEDKTIFAEVEEIKPELLGYIFDIISKAMPIKDGLKIKNIPGMADWALWGEAISRAMGNKDLEFINAYRRNIEKQNQHVIDTHPLARAIKLLYDELNDLEDKVKTNFHYNKKTNVWSTSMQDFHQQLGIIAMSDGIDIRDSKIWAHSPSHLSNRLNIINTNLRRYGIDIAIRRSTNSEDIGRGFKKGVSIVEIKSINNTILAYSSEDSEATKKLLLSY